MDTSYKEQLSHLSDIHCAVQTTHDKYNLHTLQQQKYISHFTQKHTA